MIRTAVILTVYNRREVTLQGLRSLYKSMTFLGDGYAFDIYMTDDGCTDGTSEAVVKEFPDVHIIQGDGKLYWSGGMRKAWQAAIDSGVKYDYYLWFNDDADLYDDALMTMFKSYNDAGGNAIISGAFCDKDGKVSYGGRDRKERFVVPQGKVESVFLMSGNLVLIPCSICNKLGLIDDYFKHGFGDWDYGLRAIESGFSLFLTTKYVGITERHDVDLVEYANPCLSMRERWNRLYNAKNDPVVLFKFKYNHFGLFSAVLSFIAIHVYTIMPCIYRLRLNVLPA